MQLSSITGVLENIYRSIFSCVKVIILSKFSTNIPRAQSSQCVILCNGPSLTESIEEHGDLLEQADLLCVNNFPWTPYFSILKPKYFLFSAPEYWQEGVLPSYVELREMIFNTLSETVTWKLIVFAPTGFKRNKSALDALKANNNITLIYYNTAPVEGFTWVTDILISLRLGMPRPHNVLIPSLITMIHTGYKHITLFGVDHSWLKELSVSEDNEALLNQKHFYDAETSSSTVMYKFDGVHRPRKLHEILEKFIHSFRAYHVIEQYARRKGVEIINGTPGSFIDAFQRI